MESNLLKTYIKLTQNATMIWFCKKSLPGLNMNWQRVEQWTECGWCLEREIFFYVFCLSQLSHYRAKYTRGVFRDRACPNPDTSRLAQFSNPKFAFLSGFVHYSHNSQKLIIFSGIRFKLPIDRKIKHLLPSRRSGTHPDDKKKKKVCFTLIKRISQIPKTGSCKYR